MTGASDIRLRGFALFVAFLALAAAQDAAHAKNMRTQNLMDLLTHADSILVGTVAQKSDGLQRGLPYTEITIDVRQSLKGVHGKTYTFRQFGLIAPKPTGDGRINLMVTPAGWPTYVVGEQVLLFLHKPAATTGFQTTAGLTEGKFTIRGNRIANGTDNASLFKGVQFKSPMTPGFQDLVNQPGGAYAVDTFLSLVRTAVEEKWLEKGVMRDAN
jgi:hypothetical protein